MTTTTVDTTTTNSKKSIPTHRSLLNQCHSPLSAVDLSYLSKSLHKLHSYLQNSRLRTTTSACTASAISGGSRVSHGCCSGTTDNDDDNGDGGGDEKVNVAITQSNSRDEEEIYSECASSLLRLHVVRSCGPPPLSRASDVVTQGSNGTTTTITATTEGDIVLTIDQCLDLCGLRISLLAAIDCLRSVSADGTSDDGFGAGKSSQEEEKDPTTMCDIFRCLRTIRRRMLPPPPHEEGEECFHFDLLEDFLSYDPTNTTNNNTNSSSSSINSLAAQRRKRQMEILTDLTLRLPILIANACHAHRLHLPRWAVRSSYSHRVVSSTVRLCSHNPNGGGGGDMEEERHQYLHHLIRRMIHHGGTDYVVLGLYESRASDADSDTAAAAVDGVVRRAVRDVAENSPVREGANLLCSIVRHAAAVMVEQEEEGGGKRDVVQSILALLPTNLNCRKERKTKMKMLDYTIGICREILQEFTAVRDRFVAFTILSVCPPWTSSLDGDDDDDDGGGDHGDDMDAAYDDTLTVRKVGDGKGDANSKRSLSRRGAIERRVVTRFIVLLLASCGDIGLDTESSDDNDADDDDDEDEDDNDDESSITLQNPTDKITNNDNPPSPAPSSSPPSVLMSHLEETSLLWSQPTFFHRTDRQQQRTVTEFILDGLDYMNAESLSPPPSSSSLHLPERNGDDERHNSRAARDDDDHDASRRQRRQSTIGHLMEGVTHRLRITGDSVRVDGMRIAERMAVVLGHTLRFDELDGRRGEDDGCSVGGTKSESDGGGVIVDDDEDDMEGNIEEKRIRARHKKRNKKAKIKKKVPIEIDPDEEYASASSSSSSFSSFSSSSSTPTSSDSEWDEDELIPYSDDDDNREEEDLLRFPRPKYLRECLDYLRTTPSSNQPVSAIGTTTNNNTGFDEIDTLARHKMGLEALPALIRGEPLDLPDLSVSLTRQLLNMENAYEMEDFGERVWEGLCALAVCDTVPVVVGCMIREGLFGGVVGKSDHEGGVAEFSLGTRLEVLDVIRYASSELCGRVELERRKKMQEDAIRRSRQGEITDEREHIKVMGKRSIVPLDLNQIANDAVGNLTKTRRWGRSRNTHTNTTTVTNRFGPIAPLIFYPLVHGFATTKYSTHIWGGDNGGRLLSRLLVTLSTIVYDAGTYPGIEVLATDLFELAWSFVEAENVEVRTAVLVAVATVIPHLGRGYVGRMLCGTEGGEGLGVGVVRILRGIEVGDEDEECRRLALAILGNLCLEGGFL